MEMYEIVSVATGLLCECVCVYVFVCVRVCARECTCVCVCLYLNSVMCGLWKMDACVRVSCCADRIVVVVGGGRGGGVNIGNLFIV